jgi:DNA-binding PadR family transcriptional regulator
MRMTDETRQASKRGYFGYGELPLVLMAMLMEQPSGAYELMAELDRRFGPAYKASPGGTYPAIEALLEQRLIAGDEGRPRRYRLTRPGRKALDDRLDDLAAIEVRTGVNLQAGTTTDAALARFVARTRDAALQLAPEQLDRVLDGAVKRIETLALKEKRNDG